MLFSQYRKSICLFCVLRLLAPSVAFSLIATKIVKRFPGDQLPKISKEDSKGRIDSSDDDTLTDVCVIGGGVSGLTAAINAAEIIMSKGTVVLLEASESFGGRVQSDTTEDGFVLDRGFAVFLDAYPAAQRTLDFESLSLSKFLPGAVIRIPEHDGFARVADPLRWPSWTLSTLFAPVGRFRDKIALLPLVLSARLNSLDHLFAEPETNTRDALSKRWGLGLDIISRFFEPFLEGIYLTPLENQSSRMLMFVLKMFMKGSATLPHGGIGKVSDQLASKAAEAGVSLWSSSPVTALTSVDDGFRVELSDGGKRIRCKAVVVATDTSIAQRLLSQVDPSIRSQTETTQRKVGSMYYGFKGPPPSTEPVLLLNGGPNRGSYQSPINNVCFPSAVAGGYAPEGMSLCSVTFLEDVIAHFEESNIKDLDNAVRKELAEWFPNIEHNIMDTNDWVTKGIYIIENAQPDQLQGLAPANVNGGRNPGLYRGRELGSGLYVCGDHMATSSLNGAIESGEVAGKMAARYVHQDL